MPNRSLHVSMEADPHPTYASYIDAWLKLPQGVSEAVFSAVSAASRAVAYLPLKADLQQAA